MTSPNVSKTTDFNMHYVNQMWINQVGNHVSVACAVLLNVPMLQLQLGWTQRPDQLAPWFPAVFLIHKLCENTHWYKIKVKHRENSLSISGRIIKPLCFISPCATLTLYCIFKSDHLLSRPSKCPWRYACLCVCIHAFSHPPACWCWAPSHRRFQQGPQWHH